MGNYKTLQSLKSMYKIIFALALISAVAAETTITRNVTTTSTNTVYCCETNNTISISATACTNGRRDQVMVQRPYCARKVESSRRRRLQAMLPPVCETLGSRRLSSKAPRKQMIVKRCPIDVDLQCATNTNKYAQCPDVEL